MLKKSVKVAAYCDEKSTNSFVLGPVFYIFFILLLFPMQGSAQVGINTTDIDFSAILEIESTDKGVLFPSFTEDDRDNNIMNPAIGLTIYCSNCCQDGTGAPYVYNGVEWKSLDSSCEVDPCLDLVTTITNANHMDPVDTPPLLIDGNTTLASQPNGDTDLRMHKTTDDYVTFDFPEDVPAGYKVRLYFNDNEKRMNGSGFRLGLYAEVINNGTTNQTINTDTGTLPGSTITSISGDDYYVEIVLSDITDEIFVRSANDEGDHIIFLEIKLFDDNDVEVPLTCP